MGYEHDMTAAARRTLEAGIKLEQNGRRDVAGYLFGIAAECAVKALAMGIPCARRDEIFFAHFPGLRALVRESLQGRSAQPLLRLLEHDSFMNEWDISLRYARAAILASKPVDAWREQARRAVNLVNG